MGILGWFDSTVVETFAKDVAERLVALSQRSSAVAGAGSKKIKKILEGFDGLLIEVESFAEKTPMNIYKKAKFLNTVKWTLEERECSQEFIAKAISALSASINRR